MSSLHLAMTTMEKLDNVIFYSIDKAIRSYRQFAQNQLKKHGFDITVDQWLVIKCLMENPHLTQVEVADLVFKDNASVTRIINLLVQSDYLLRKVNKSDRRRTEITVTQKGRDVIASVDALVLQNRSHALAGISQEELAATSRTMQTIFENCKK